MPKRRASVNATDPLLAGAPYATLTPEERLALLASLAALPGCPELAARPHETSQAGLRTLAVARRGPTIKLC
jgi:hypothetical protein